MFKTSLPRLGSFALVVLASSAVVAALVLIDRGRRAPEPLALQFATPIRREIRVDVAGAVVLPGVLTLHAGDCVEDALAAAGGPTSDADLAQVNRAALLVDGQRVTVPRLGEERSDGLVDLNAAPAAVLEVLPGVGPVTAAAIVASRESVGPFMRVEELAERGLLAASDLDAIRPLVGPLP